MEHGSRNDWSGTKAPKAYVSGHQPFMTEPAVCTLARTLKSEFCSGTPEVLIMPVGKWKGFHERCSVSNNGAIAPMHKHWVDYLQGYKFCICKANSCRVLACQGQIMANVL